MNLLKTERGDYCLKVTDKSRSKWRKPIYRGKQNNNRSRVKEKCK